MHRAERGVLAPHSMVTNVGTMFLVYVTFMIGVLIYFSYVVFYALEDTNSAGSFSECNYLFFFFSFCPRQASEK